MKNIFAAIPKLITALALVGGTLLGGAAYAQSPLDWKVAQHFDTGVQTSVAVTPSGLVIEFHRSQNNNTIWYRVGKAGETWDRHPFVRWAKNSNSLSYDGQWPSVAITKEGYLVLVYTKSDFGRETQMRYWVGKLDPSGDEKQTISWKVKNAFYDTGQYATVAFNANDILVDVHESANNSNLYYRIGHFLNPAAGHFDLVWDSGSYGREYDTGANPHISVNQNNEILEVHQSGNKTTYIHYRRGRLYTTHIGFASTGSVHFDSGPKQPAVALANNNAIEVDSQNDATFARTGLLSSSWPDRVDWSDPVEIGWSGYQGIAPSVTTDGTAAIATWESKTNLFYSIAWIK
jgi:hypothetical protein